MRFHNYLYILPILIISLVAPIPAGAQSVSKKGKAKTASTTKAKSAKAVTSTSKKTKTIGKAKTSTKTSGVKPPTTSEEAKRRQAETQKEIARTKEEIRKNEAEVKKGLNELGKLRENIAIAKKQVESAEQQVNDLDSAINRLESEITVGEDKLTTLRENYLKAIKKIRSNRNTNSDLAFIFSSKNFSEAMRRMRYLRQFSSWKEKQSAEISTRVAELKTQKNLLAQSKREKNEALAREVKARNQLNSRFQEQDALVVKLKQNGKALNSHLAKKQAEANDLRNRISSLIAQEQRKAEEAARKAEAERKAKEAKEAEAAKRAEEESKNLANNKDKNKDNNKDKDKGKNVDYAEARKRKPRSGDNKSGSDNSGSAAATSASTSGFASMKGTLPRPVSGSFRVTSPFGRHALPELPDVMYDNPGIDAQVDAGANALAVYSGKVSGVYMIPGYSTVVIVNHGNYYTVYGNIASPAVKVGDTIKQGQALGRLSAAEEDDSHSAIHFEVWKNREKLNPLDWIK